MPSVLSPTPPRSVRRLDLLDDSICSTTRLSITRRNRKTEATTTNNTMTETAIDKDNKHGNEQGDGTRVAAAAAAADVVGTTAAAAIPDVTASQIGRAHV